MKLRARKRFGQHFLVDDGVLQSIASAINLSAKDRLLEIGPGTGALTQLLVDQPKEYLAIELDRDLVPRLRQQFPSIEIINEDILRFDFAQLNGPNVGSGWRVVGNLPYNISSPLLALLFEHIHLIADMHFMFQKEMANRLCAQPGTKAWGRLTVMAQYKCHAEILLDVPPQAFAPPPKVESSVVRLIPRVPELVVVNEAHFATVLRTAFSARRKRLGNGLKAMNVDWQALDISADLRPDQIGVQEFVRITNATYSGSDSSGTECGE